MSTEEKMTEVQRIEKELAALEVVKPAQLPNVASILGLQTPQLVLDFQAQRAESKKQAVLASVASIAGDPEMMKILAGTFDGLADEVHFDLIIDLNAALKAEIDALKLKVEKTADKRDDHRDDAKTAKADLVAAREALGKALAKLQIIDPKNGIESMITDKLAVLGAADRAMRDAIAANGNDIVALASAL